MVTLVKASMAFSPPGCAEKHPAQRQDNSISHKRSIQLSNDINEKNIMNYAFFPASDVVIDADYAFAQKAGADDGVPLGTSIVTVWVTVQIVWVVIVVTQGRAME